MQNRQSPVGAILQQAVNKRHHSDWLIIDKEQRLVYGNQAFMQRWKLQTQKSLQQPLATLFESVKDAQLWLWAFQDALSEQKLLDGIEVQIQSKPTTWSYTWTQQINIPDDDRSPYILGTFIEINRYKQMENHLARIDTDVVKAFTHAMDLRDSYTSRHSDSVASLAGMLGTRMRVRKGFANDCRMAGYLHDLGKLLVPRSILNKPTRLTEEEFALVRDHPAASAEIIADVGSLRHLSKSIRAHHERWDGTGYPDQLQGESIPLIGRVLAICDSYHAMISHRTYKRLINPSDALQEIARCAGTQFDPTLAALFVKIMRHAEPVARTKKEESAYELTPKS